MATLESALEINKYHAIVEAQIDVGASLAIFWPAFGDLHQWTRWVPGLEEARWIDQPEWGLGSHFYAIQHMPFPLGRCVSTFTLTALSPERAVQWVGPTGRLVQMVWWNFDETDAGTRVTARQLYHGSWLRLYRWMLFERRMRGLLALTLQRLKLHVERGA